MPKWLWIALLGFALLLPGALYWIWIWISDPVRTTDTQIAFQRMAEAPLSEAAGDRGVEITAKIPSDASWMRVIRNWGDPGYFIGAVLLGPSHYMYCLCDLGARVEARIGDQPVDLEIADAPYGYSADCRPAGLSFRAPPGSVVRIHVTVASLPSQESYLVVEPHWTVETKDRLVGIGIEEQLHLRAVTTGLGVAGIITIMVAAFLFSRRSLLPAG
ncbi:MAG: hypothetical protein ACOYX1_11260 [Acidobacteriota bacterium]